MSRLGLGCAVLLGCVVPDVSIVGRPCPCPEGYACDAATETCVEAAGGAPATTGTAAGAEGAGAGGAGAGNVGGGGPCLGSCGTAGCGPCPDVAMIDAGDFSIDALEVTRGAYQVFLADAVDPAVQDPWCSWNSSFDPGEDIPGGCPAPYDYSQPGFPMTCIDWCDAAAYCTWAGKHLCGRKGGGTVPLADVDDPTASEWYAACSADGTLAFPYGDTFQDTFCNTFGNASDVIGSGWFPDCEGGFPGLLDMLGNVEEWEDACEITADSAGDNCFLRGGAFWCDASTPDRDYATCVAAPDRRPDRSAFSHDWGFRCCDQ